MSSSLSMTTSTAARSKTKFLWHVRRTPSGELRLIPMKHQTKPVLEGGTMYATLTSRMIREGKTDQAIRDITNAGGAVSSVKGRRMLVEVEGENVEAVGDVFDSFGCQWDLS